jgi:hypothetical protein
VGLALSTSAIAEEEKLHMGGVVFGHWGADLNEMTNEFDLDRVYLNARRNIGDSFAIRITTDVGREEIQTVNVPYMGTTLPIPVAEDTQTRVYLKYAYLEWKEALPGVKLRFGMAETAWNSQFNRFWSHRWVRKSFADQHGLLASSDLGVQALGSLSDGMVTWQAGIVNGTGYGSPESDASKTAQLRVTVNPMASSGGKLPVSGFVSYDPVDLGAEGDAGITYAAGAGYKVDAGLIWAEYIGRSEGEASGAGYSVSTVCHLGDFGHAVARYDSWDGDTRIEGDRENTALVGLAHNYAEQISMGVFYERTLPEGDADDVQSVIVRMQAGF